MPIEGPFVEFFKQDSTGVPVYLHLSNMASQASSAALRDLSRAAADKSNAHRFITFLLMSRSWRSQLVGALAVLCSKHGVLHLDALWFATDSGNLMSAAKLGVVASFVDPAFEQMAGTRLSTDTINGELRGALLFLTGVEDLQESDSLVNQGFSTASKWTSPLKARAKEAGIDLLLRRE
jgi:hypothetical protein